MKPLLIVGIIMIVLGGVALAYQGFSYTKEETILDIGPLQATAETTERVPVPPLVGWALIIGGGIAATGALIQSKKA